MTSRRTIFAVIIALAMGAFCIHLSVQWQARSPLDPPPAASPDEWFRRGMQGIRDRDAEEVRRALNGLEAHADQSEQLLLFRGALSLLSENPQVALDDFARIKPQGPLRDPLLTLTGEALYRVGKLDEAQRCLLLALQDTPDNADTLRWLATVHYDLGDIEKTLHILHEVCRVAPQDYRPHHMQGVIYRDFGAHQEAITELRQALELAGEATIQEVIRSLLASSLMSLKQFDSALMTLQGGPPTTLSLSLMADCLWQMGQTGEAGETLLQAESLGTLPEPGSRLKARILIERGELHAARQRLESLISLDSSDDESEYMLALLFRQLKDEPQSAIHLKRSEHLKSLKSRLTEWSQKAMQEPANAEVRDQLAGLCDQLGMKSLARVWRTAAASCRRHLSPVVPGETVTP